MAIRYVLTIYDEGRISRDKIAFLAFKTFKDYKRQNLESKKFANITREEWNLANYITAYDLPEVPIVTITESATKTNHRRKGHFTELINNIKSYYADAIICAVPYYDTRVHPPLRVEEIYSKIINPTEKMLIEKHGFININKFVERDGVNSLVYPTGKNSKLIINSILNEYYSNIIND